MVSDTRGFNMRRHYRSSDHSGLGICDVLALIFITLKLIGVIDWSWWIVLAPWWIPVLIVAITAFVAWIFN